MILATSLHVSSAVELALAMKDVDRAEASLELLCQLDEVGPRTEQLRRRIYEQKNPMSSLKDQFLQMLRGLN